MKEHNGNEEVSNLDLHLAFHVGFFGEGGKTRVDSSSSGTLATYNGTHLCSITRPNDLSRFFGFILRSKDISEKICLLKKKEKKNIITRKKK